MSSLQMQHGGNPQGSGSGVMESPASSRPSRAWRVGDAMGCRWSSDACLKVQTANSMPCCLSFVLAPLPYIHSWITYTSCRNVSLSLHMKRYPAVLILVHPQSPRTQLLPSGKRTNWWLITPNPCRCVPETFCPGQAWSCL